MKSFAVVRADSTLKVHTALLDLRRYGRMVFAGTPKYISPDYADEILTRVVRRPLKNKCYSAAVVPLNTTPSVAIGKLSKIHPPAHVVIVSSKHDIFDELKNNVGNFPEFEIRKKEVLGEGKPGAQKAAIASF